MEAAKSAINKFTSTRGHTTDVDEVVNPAITQEVIKPHRHEELTQAVDREVHQDHYHTTVQPIQHREVLPEQHKHNMLPVENREFQHGNHAETQQRVQAELGQFKDRSVVQETHHTKAAAATITGEHVHHHVHETVQPIINKETIRPEVIHTTVPIHETHHGAAEHHGMSALPMKTLDEFKRAGGVLSGTQSRHTHEEYEGAPRPYNTELQTDIEKLGLGSHHGTGHHAGAGVGAVGVGAGVGAGGLAGRHHRSGSVSSFSSSDEEGRRTGTRRVKDRTHKDRSHRHGANQGYPNTSTTTNTTTNTSTGTKKPSLLDRLNPRKDVDGDGKAGFMD